MNTEQTADLARRAGVHAALADVTRLRIVDLLARSDRSASELGAALDIPSNLLAHHLKALHAAGLLTRRQSEGDARRWYLSLAAHDDGIVAGSGPADGEALVPAGRIVFVCTANSARSHLAAAAWRRVSSIPVTSAGTHPGERVHPGALDAAQRHGLEVPAVAPRTLDPHDEKDDIIVTVCDRAHEDLHGRDWAHWSIPDPVPGGHDSDFDAALDLIVDRVGRLSPLMRST